VLESKTKAAFIKPMLLLQTERLPEGSKWAYELKLDGYRALAIKTGGKVYLRSRNYNDFSRRYPAVVQALGALPDETVIDGEVVALDESVRPSSTRCRIMDRRKRRCSITCLTSRSTAAGT
jgi:bifunctional non-homologous end joining protein LigD